MEKKFDKMDDRLVYFFLGGIVLKGGFDFYVNERKHSCCPQGTWRLLPQEGLMLRPSDPL